MKTGPARLAIDAAAPARRSALPTGWSGCWCLTGALGNAVVTANLQLLQGTFAARSTEIAAAGGAYVMTNVSINLLLVKFRQQFGLRAFTEGLASACWSPSSTCSSTIPARR